MDLASGEADVQTGENVLSVAQAYPEEPVAVPEAPVVSDDAAKVPRDYNFDNAEEPQIVEAEIPVVDVAAEIPAPVVPVAAAAPANRYLPSKKKVIVELEQSAEAEADEAEENALAVADDVEQDDDEEVEEAPVVVAKKPARRPVAKKPAKAAAPAKPAKPALPAGTFFPIDFGGTNGGAIAIANSFSTGEGGSATSHAIAYGNAADAARARRPASKRH